MQTNALTIAAGLSDDELLARLPVLARNEREASAELVAHLAVLDTRPALYAADGYGSLFSYCTRALALSEDAACNRIEAARACRQFPCLLERLAAGALSLTSLRLLGRHLTEENHRAVLRRAENRSRREIEALVAELAPRPDALSQIRRLQSVPVETKAAPGPAEEPTRAAEAVATPPCRPRDGRHTPAWRLWRRSATACTAPSTKRPRRDSVVYKLSFAGRSRTEISE
jgi:hypothetical protein